MERIINFEESLEDEMHSSQVVVHYGTYHTRQLVSALNWPNWISYKIDCAERTVSNLALYAKSHLSTLYPGASPKPKQN